jgi:hypothetical protein
VLQRVDIENMSMGPHAWHRKEDPEPLPNTMDLHVHLPGIGIYKVRQPIACSARLGLSSAKSVGLPCVFVTRTTGESAPRWHCC